MFSLWHHQVAASDDFETGSQPDNDSFGNSKSQDPASSESSDSALNHFGPASDPAFVSLRCKTQLHCMGMCLFYC